MNSMFDHSFELRSLRRSSTVSEFPFAIALWSSELRNSLSSVILAMWRRSRPAWVKIVEDSSPHYVVEAERENK